MADFKALDDVDALDKAEGTKTGDVVPKGDLVRDVAGDFGETPDPDWLHFVFPATGTQKFFGWAKQGLFEAASATIEPKAIDEAPFVRRAVSVADTFSKANEQHTAVADFLIALPVLVSGFQGLVKGERIGPFQYRAKDWGKFIGFEPPAGFLAVGSPITQVFNQLNAAAIEMHLNGAALTKDHADAGLSTEANPFIPDYRALLHAHLLGHKAAFALWQARQPGGASVADLKELVMSTEGLSDADAVALFNERPEFYLDDAGALLDTHEFNRRTASKLNAAFAKARQLIVAHVPELAAAPSGATPWMDTARALAAKNLSETKDAAEIRGFFAATNFGVPDPDKPPPAWCGAFAAHCMKSVGGAIAASVPKGAAAAVNWRKWGDKSLSFAGDAPIPPGAVVVLSPGEGTDTTGHVGFFVERSGSDVRLLGGNQSNTARVSGYPASRVVEVRWLS